MEDRDMIHVLLGGRALCGFSKEKPCNWPDNHLWVRIDNFNESNCEPCKKRAQEHMRVGV